MAAAPPLSLSIHAPAGKAYTHFLRRHMRSAHRYLRPPLKDLSLALVGDAKMSVLHEQFLGIPGPTDVLTFPLDFDRRGRPLSGEVVVCVPEARRRAKEQKVTVERELLLYALHGLLHLCGYDDRTDDSFAAMHRTEDQILTRLGVGPVFSPAPGKRSVNSPRRARRRDSATVSRRRQTASGGAH